MFSILAKSFASDVIAQLPKLNTDESEKMINELQAAFKQQLEIAIEKAQLVSKTEFDAQANTLQRLQDKVNSLEKHVAELESTLKK